MPYTTLIVSTMVGGAGGGGGGGSLPTPTTIDLAPSAPGNFTVAHGLGGTPKAVIIEMTSDGQIYYQAARFDATNLYLVASDGGITGKALAWT